MDFHDFLGTVYFAESGEGLSPTDKSIGVGDFFDAFDVLVILQNKIYAAYLFVVLKRKDIDKVSFN